VPWATVEVSKELQNKLFPFAEKALTELKASGQVNHGTVNFLQLLQQVQALDQQWGTLSMPKFHRSLQPKKGPKPARQ